MAEPIQPRDAAPTAEQPTEVIPAEAASAEQATLVIETPAPPRKRRRWVGWVIAGGVLVVLLVVGFFVGDVLARQFAEQYVRERILQVLDLDPETPVDVDLGPGSLLLQAARGSVDVVTVSIDELTVGEVTAGAVLTATGVPLDDSKPVESLDIVAKVSEQNVQKLSGYLSGIDLESIELGRGVITVGTNLNLLFLTLPVTVDLVPSAAGSGVVFEPETITLDDQAISVDDLRNNPIVGSIASSLLNSQEFCVASSLPKALQVTDVVVSGTNLVVTLTGGGVALSSPDLTTNGTCP
ncbi:LmeA family phospholipid-binding protein [Schumannella luteola]